MGHKILTFHIMAVNIFNSVVYMYMVTFTKLGYCDLLAVKCCLEAFT